MLCNGKNVWNYKCQSLTLELVDDSKAKQNLRLRARPAPLLKSEDPYLLTAGSFSNGLIGLHTKSKYGAKMGRTPKLGAGTRG